MIYNIVMMMEKQEKRTLEPDEHYYIRHGIIKGNSLNINRGELLSKEQGLSVWYAEVLSDGRIVNDSGRDVVQESWEYVWDIHGDEPIYLLSGTEVGKGADGEPLLDPESVEIIAELEYHEGRLCIDDYYLIKE